MTNKAFIDAVNERLNKRVKKKLEKDGVIFADDIYDIFNDLNIRLKAIEKRLNIKPFYEPTEDEKDDD